MNRHRANWSVMGIEPATEQSALQKRREHHKEQLVKMILQYSHDGLHEVISILRGISEMISIENSSLDDSRIKCRKRGLDMSKKYSEQLEQQVNKIDGANGRLLHGWQIPEVQEAMRMLASVSIELGRIAEGLEEDGQ